MVHAVKQVLVPGCVPVCTSDSLRLYYYALTAHFGQWLTDPATGRPKWRVALDLLYGQVIKAYRRRKLAKVQRHVQHGQLHDFKSALQRLGFTGTINTAFVERLNLTLRQGIAALTRQSWATAQLTPELEAYLEWWRAWYHFCRPHQELQQKRGTPQKTRQVSLNAPPSATHPSKREQRLETLLRLTLVILRLELVWSEYKLCPQE